MSNHDREGSHPSNRDATLERVWREVSDEQPPAHLDAAIVAAARESVAGRGQQPNTAPTRIAARTWLQQWQSLAAAASVAGLAFVLVQMLPREQDRAPSTQRQESAPVATESLPQGSPARAATDDSQPPTVGKAIDPRSRADVAVEAPGQAAIPAPPTMPASRASKAEATASDSAELLGESSADRRRAVAPETPGRGVPAAAAPSTSAMTMERSPDNAVPLDAAAWVARIATLRAAGDVTAAEHALRAFRAAEPDADSYLPESLRSWARTVR